MTKNEWGKGHAKATLTEQAYQLIKWQILSMELPPGSYLNELELCERTGFGRAPVHLALQRLMHDHLIEVLPRKGAIVRSWSPRDVNNLIEARMPVEATAARLAAERGAKGDVQKLRQQLSKGPTLIAKRDREGLIRLDRDFHLGLADLSRNGVLRDLVERLHQQSAALWFLQLSSEATYRTVQAQHEAIIAAVGDANANGAEKQMRDHLESFRLSAV